MKKTAFNVVMTGALSLGVLGAASLPAFAASSSSTDSGTKEKVETVMENLRTKLEAIGWIFLNAAVCSPTWMRQQKRKPKPL